MRRQSIFAALLLLAAACNDGNGPGNFGPGTTADRVMQAFGAVQNNKAVQSMDVLSGAFTFAGTSAPSPAPAPPANAPTPVATLERITLGLAGSAAGLLPAGALGKTFIYNAQTARYEPGDDPGAPANGARFVLYAVDTATRSVITPLQPIGYVDVVDKSGATNTLGITAVLNGTTVLSYDASGAVGNGLVVTAKGFAIDGTSRLDFDLSQTLTGSSVKVDYKLTAPTQNNLGVELVASGSALSLSSATLTVNDNNDKLEIAVTGSGQNASGTVKFNAKVVANVTITGNSPVFTAANGRTLSTDDLRGLKDLVDFVDKLLNRFDDALAPAYFVFGISR